METTTQDPAQQEAEERRRRWPLARIGIVVVLLLVGAGFAASISINNDTAAEFGQGVEAIAACDSAATATGTPGITVSLGSAADVLNSQFTVSNVFLTDIDAQCEGKWLKLGLYDDLGTVIDEIVFFMDSTDLTTAPFRAAALAGNTTQAGCSGTSFTGANFPDGSTPTIGTDCWASLGTNYELASGTVAGDVYYVTIESSDNPPSAV